MVQEIGGQHDVEINWMLPPEPVSPEGYAGVCEMVQRVREDLGKHKINTLALCGEVWDEALKKAKTDSLLSANEIAPIVMYTLNEFFLVLNVKLQNLYYV